jgi:uroporphyrinogen-III synthase
VTKSNPKVAVFRPDDGRLASAADHLRDLGASPVADPMLSVEPTGATPREDAEFVVLTSKTGVELAAEADWTPSQATLCAIGETTANALREADYSVDRVPDTYTSQGLVERLASEVDGKRVEVARSDHGSAVLLDGLREAGAYVHETVLYRLTRPAGAGESVTVAADGDLDGALFTSSLTVEHFLAAAEKRGMREAAVAGLEDAIVGAIGEPTRGTAAEADIAVDVVPEEADFEALARAGVERL